MRIEEGEAVVLMTPEGEVAVPCDRVIARLGAVPPRSFVESCGVRFPSKDPAAVPELSPHFETSVPGLYIVGALAGYELIKQAINQGREVAEHLAGQPVEPADQKLLAQRFAAAYPGRPVAEVLARIQAAVPMFAGLTTLKLRAAMLDSVLHRFPAGSTVFRKGDYTNSVYNIIEGRVRVDVGAEAEAPAILIAAGEFFGEMGLIRPAPHRRDPWPRPSCWRSKRRAAPCCGCSVPIRSVKEALDRVALRRLVHNSLGPDLPIPAFDEACAAAELCRLDPHEAVITEGDTCQALYIVQRGAMTVTKEIDGARVSLGYIAAGQVFGERGLLDPGARRAATVRATIESEVIRIGAEPIRQLMALEPGVRAIFQAAVQQQFDTSVRSAVLRGLPDIAMAPSMTR